MVRISARLSPGTTLVCITYERLFIGAWCMWIYRPLPRDSGHTWMVGKDLSLEVGGTLARTVAPLAMQGLESRLAKLSLPEGDCWAVQVMMACLRVRVVLGVFLAGGGLITLAEFKAQTNLFLPRWWSTLTSRFHFIEPVIVNASELVSTGANV